MRIAKRLADLGIILPEAPRPMAAYIPAVISGNLLFVSGQLCLVNGELLYKGRLGQEVSLEQGYGAARAAATTPWQLSKKSWAHWIE